MHMSCATAHATHPSGPPLGAAPAPVPTTVDGAPAKRRRARAGDRAPVAGPGAGTGETPAPPPGGVSPLNRQQVTAFFAQLAGLPRLIALLQYGCGLHLVEAVRLRVADLDLERRLIVVRGPGRGAIGWDCSQTPWSSHGRRSSAPSAWCPQRS